MIPLPRLSRVRDLAARSLVALALVAPVAAQAIVITISPAPVGGRVTSDVGGIDCPGTCTSADLGSFASVQLTATADPGYAFVEWQESGFGVGSSSTYLLFASSNRIVTAVFGGSPAFPGPNTGTLTVLTAGSVAIPVTGQPAPTVVLVSGNLPSGVSLAADGTLSGTPASGTVGPWPISVSGTNTYGFTTAAYTLTVQKASQTIGFAATPPASVPLSAGSLALQAQATSGLDVTYSTTTPAVCGTYFAGITFVGTGTCEFQVDQAGDANWNAAPQVALSIAVQAAPVVSSSNIATFPIGQSTQFQLAATGFPAPTIGLTGTLPPGVRFDASTSRIVGAALAGTVGTYALQVTASNGVGAPAVQNLELNVSKGPQAITTPGSSRRGKLVGDPPFDIGAFSSALLPLSFTTSTPAVCSVSGARVTLTGARGACTITATQAGDANFLAAAPVSWSIDVDSARVDTVAGGGVADGIPAVDALLRRPTAAVLLPDGSLLVADTENNRVRRISAGTISTYAGTGVRGFSGDGGPATAARLDGPLSLAVDGAGNVYIADVGNHRIRKVTPAGTISTFAGSGANAVTGDGGPATGAALSDPKGLAVSPAGELHFIDGTRFVRKVTAAGMIATVAGNRVRGYHGDGGPALQSALNYPHSLAFDAAGHLYVSDTSNYRVRRISAASGTITTFAGTGVYAFSPDGGAATATALSLPYGIAIDSAGHLLIAEQPAGKVRKVDGSGIVSTVAGGGTFPGVDDGGAATGAIVRPEALAAGPGGAFYIVDWQASQVRLVNGAGAIFTVANKARPTFGGDGGPGRDALLQLPAGIAVDAAGNVFIADRENNRVRKLSPSGVITTVAGTGAYAFSGDGGPATSAALAYPQAVAVDAAGNLYIADTGNVRIRKVTPQGIIGTYAGNGTPGFTGDGGPATAASIGQVYGLAVAPDATLHIADSTSSRVRRVAANGTITTVAGNGSAAPSGDGGPATGAGLNPMALAFDAAGNLYIADYGNSQVRRVGAAGTISTFAGTGAVGYSGDGGPATAATLRTPTAVSVDPFGNVYIADANNDVIRRVDAGTGVITSLTNASGFPYAGEAEPPSVATMDRPEGVAADALGNVYISDTTNSRVRKVTFDSQPSAFSFPSQAGVSPGSMRTSQAITPAGYDATAVVTVAGGEYAVGCSGPFTAARGAIDPGQSVCVRHTASSSTSTTVTTTLSIGGVTGTFSSTTAAAATPGALSANPASPDFGGQSMGTASPALAVTLTNTGGSAVTVSSVTTSTYFAVSHDCSTLAAGASCNASVTFTPTAQGSLNGTLTVQSSAGTLLVPLAGTGERSLVTHYYRSILRRAPDGGGRSFWESEAARMTSLGANVNETWYAMAVFFFTSAEYLGLNRDDAGFVTDLYNTFFNRPPDGGGISYWTGQIAQGMPREVVLVSFMLSPEFVGFTEGIFGNTAARKEVDTVMDFYRGLLSRLPDPDGFNYWVGQFRTAQCQGAGAVYAQAESISSSFMNGGEYAARNRTNSQFVGDLYNAFLRRGGDLGGVQYWIDQLATGARSRDQVRQQFIASAEFNARVNAIIAQGCLP